MIRTRIAPSPTGEDLHIGNAYTALINYAFAKRYSGKFIIRIEDTDRTRYIEDSEQQILSSMSWLGLSHDEGPDINGPFAPYRQSERLELYRKYAQELIDKGYAYYCFCTPKRLSLMRKQQQKEGKIPRYDGSCRGVTNFNEKIRSGKPYIIRLAVPKKGSTAFNDSIRGTITFNNEQIDDQVLIKSDGFPTYHLAVVVDDHLMKISHVIRGEEWISSTPKHILLYKFLEWNIPVYAHLPLLRNPDRSKLSKRKNPVWISWYKKKGFLPEALLNFFALMGWSHPKEKEFFSMQEFIRVFSLDRIHPVGPVFDLKKLEWMNSVYIRKMKDSMLEIKIKKFLGENYDKKIIKKSIPLIKDRIKTLSEYRDLCEFFFTRPDSYEQHIQPETLKQVMKVLQNISWRNKTLHKVMNKLADELQTSKRKLFMQIRIAITGKKIGPPLFESMEILGRTEVFARLSKATKKT